MLKKLEIRQSMPGDSNAIESLYPKAFPDEDLLPLVRELLPDKTGTISLVGAINSQIAGHVIFTMCGVAGSHASAALLGPLAVAPAWQKQGIGSAIVRDGLRRLENTEVNLVFVLGDPAYYGRFGFLAETLIEPPFSLPAEWDGAWQSLSVGEKKRPGPGKLSVPRPWRQKALWAP